MIKKTLLGIIFSFSFVAQANHQCSGRVLDTQVNRTGVVYASIEGVVSSGTLCDLSPGTGGDAEFCKVLYSTLLVAQTTQKEVTLWFNIDTDSSCKKRDWSNLYTEHGFYHFRIKN